MTWWMWLLVALAILAPIVAFKRSGGDLALTGITGLVVACVVALAILIPLSIQDQNRWEKWCAGVGGHVHEIDDMVTTVSTNGKPGIGVTTTYYCLTADGRVLDIHS